MPIYPSRLDLSSSHLRFLTARIRERRRAIGSRWRRLSAGRQALLTLAHLRNGQFETAGRIVRCQARCVRSACSGAHVNAPTMR